MSLLRKLWQFLRPFPVKPTTSATEEEPVIDLGQLFHHQLLAAVTARFPAIRATAQEGAIHLAPDGLTLFTSVLDRATYPAAFTCALSVRVFHPLYFPACLEEFLAGIGEDARTAIANGANVYIEGVLDTILEGLSASHNPELDILAPSGEPAWHPVIGTLQVQGAWTAHSNSLDIEHFFKLLRPALLAHLSSQPFHWLKVYSSRRPDGKYIGDCLLDNQPWPAGLALLQSEAMKWPYYGQFAGQKQFILLRKCGLQ